MSKARVNITQGIESLFGTRDENIRLLERALGVSTHLLDDSIEIEGDLEPVRRAEHILSDYEFLLREGHRFTNGDVKGFLKVVAEDPNLTLRNLVLSSRRRTFGRRSPGSSQPQPDALSRGHRALRHGLRRRAGRYRKDVSRRGDGGFRVAQQECTPGLSSPAPAVEAGERLGFLPGTLQQKIDPYLRPLYDALYDMLDYDRVERLLEKEIIEIAPLAFMRGRSLNESFIILDEGQNATAEQMKMFITRLGSSSKAVITGDITQIDLPAGKRSGLLEAVDVLNSVEGVAFVYFDETDVVRHELVQRIVRAYESYDRGRLGEDAPRPANDSDDQSSGEVETGPQTSSAPE